MSVKKIFILFGLLIFIASCHQEQKNSQEISSDVVNVPATGSGEKVDQSKLPVFSFTEETHDFGRITQGEKVSYAFKFKNTGGSDLVISSAQGSCGCTVPQYSKNPVSPYAEGVIDVVFNSEGKSGKVTKTVTIVSNTNPSTKVLTIKADIIVPEK